MTNEENIPKKSTPADTLDNYDPGDDVQARFRYQHTYTAIQCLSLIEANGPLAIYCEHHEDILVEEKNGDFKGIQVKTKQFTEKPFRSTSKDFKKSIARFARLENKFPDQFTNYLFVTNHGFRSEKKSPHLNPQYFIDVISTPDKLKALPVTDPIKKNLTNLCDKYELEVEKVISAISKTKIEGYESGIGHLEPELIKTIQKTCKLDHKPSKLSKRIADNLIFIIYYASSKKISEKSVDLYSPQKKFSEVMDELIIEGKKINSDKVKKTITDTITQFAPELIRLGIEAGEIKKPNYKTIPDYIPRKVFNSDEYNRLSKYFINENQKNDILEVIKEKKRIVLLGDGGTGKSTELQRIASAFSEEASGFYPCLVFLNKYVNQNIEDLLPPGWESLSEGSLLIILDGLDEIESKNKNDAIRKIELFSEQYPDCTMVISCRRNFYNVSSGLSSGSIENFEAFSLLELDFNSIKKYVENKIGIRSDLLFNEISESDISDLIFIPFYLSSLVEIFATNNKLPRSKSLIFEQLIDLRIQLDEKHYRTTINLEETKELILTTLESVALGMECFGRNYIADNELYKIVPELNLRKLIKHTSLMKKTNEEDVKWQFEHNHIQEYLAAKQLSSHDINIIKKIITFPPEHNKIIPSWTNTISFLLNFSKNNELLDWILEVEPEIIVHAEPDKIDEHERVKFFQNIFNDFKTKKTWIDKDKFPYNKLAKFAKNDENINFLFTEAEQAKHYTSFSNAIDMLGRMELSGDNKIRLKTILVDAAVNNTHFDIPPHIQQTALSLIAKNNLNSKEVIDIILPALRNAENDWVRYGLYYFLYTSIFLDEHIDIFLEGVRYVRFRYSDDSSSRRSRLGNESWELKNGLLKVSSPQAIRKIFQYFTAHGRDLNELFYGDTEDLKKLAENALKAYQSDSSILNDATQLFQSMMHSGQNNEAKAFVIFFELTNTRLEVFQKILDFDNFHRNEMLSLVADQTCLEYLLTQYNESKIKEYLIWSILHYLEWYNGELKEIFKEELINRYGDRFHQKPKRDLDKEEQERSQRDFDLLFEDKQTLIDELKLIYEKENKDSFSEKETYHIRTNNWPDLYYSQTAMELIRNNARSGPVSFEDVVEKIEKIDWEWFCISKIYETLSNENKVHVSDEQKEWVREWCRNRLDIVDFKNAITKTGEKSTSIRWDSIYIWFFFREFHFEYPENILLDMISFDFHRTGIEYLDNFIYKHKMTERILDNLKSGIVIDSVYINHLNYCKAHKITEAIPYAVTEILNPDRDQYDDVRSAALGMLSVTPEGLIEPESILPEVQDDFKWKIIDCMVENESKNIQSFLSSILQKGSEEDRLKASEYLIQCQNIEALKYFAEYIKTKKQYTPHIIHRSPLKSLKTIDALPILIDLLDLCYREGITKTDDFDRLDRITLDAIQKIALQSEENFLKAKSVIEDFIQKNMAEYDGINWLYSYLAGVEQQFYVNKSDNINIDDVLKLMSQLKMDK